MSRLTKLRHYRQQLIRWSRPGLRFGRRQLAVIISQAARHKRFTAIVLIIIGLSCFLIIRLTGQPAAANQAEPDNTFQANTSGALAKGTPQYTTLLPRGHSIDQLGGWTRISPPNKNPVYAYTDQLNGVNISVSQQPLPADLQPDVAAQIAELAKNFGATNHFSALDTTVYIGTSAKGPQSLILTKSNVLILVKSSAPLGTDTWQGYLNALN